MKHNTDTLWASAMGVSTSMGVYLIGGVDKLIIAYMVIMAIDYISGIMAGFYNKQVSSKTAFKGLMKKGAMLLLIIVAVQVDHVNNSGHFVRNSVLFFLIAMEGISFIENLGRMDVKVPKVLSDAFSQLKDRKGEKR